MRVAISRDRIESEFTGWITALERIVLKKDRFLGDLDGAPRAETPQPELKLKTVEVEDFTLQQSKESNPEPPVAGQPLPQSNDEQLPARDEHKPAVATLFGEKLKAVLQPRK
jgi:hypothetical protein